MSEDNNNTNVFEVLGQTISVSADEIKNAIKDQVVRTDSRAADAAERTADALERMVRLLKPWAEREKRKNLIEQDPDYLEAIIKQVQEQRKKTKTKKPKYYKPIGTTKKTKLKE